MSLFLMMIFVMIMAIFQQASCQAFYQKAFALSKNTCLVKIQVLFSNCVYLENILPSEWLGKQISS